MVINYVFNYSQKTECESGDLAEDAGFTGWALPEESGNGSDSFDEVPSPNVVMCD
jgi:hypothetical protein